MIGIQDIINQIKYLQPIPQNITRVLAVLDIPEVSLDEVHKTIQYDPVLSADVLKLCNSPFFSRRRTISSLRGAIALIGLEELKKSMLFLASTVMFKDRSPGYETHDGELLRHVVAAAVISLHLKPYLPDVFTDLFTTALLHDVGKLVLQEYVDQSGEEITRVMHAANLTFEDAELQVIGFTHAEVGAIILNRWNFPDEMVMAVRYHHHPDQVPDSVLTHFVALADIIAMLMGYSTGNDGLAYQGYAPIFARYGLDERAIEQIIMQASDHINEVFKLLP